jgi:hypothetical protein
MEKAPFVEWLDRYCQEQGCVQEVGEEFYRVFLTTTAGELTALIRALLFESAHWASRSENTSLRTETGLCNNVEALLDLVAMGRAVILDNGRLGFTKPVGPPPLPETGRAIAARLRAARPLIRSVLREMTVLH